MQKYKMVKNTLLLLLITGFLWACSNYRKQNSNNKNIIQFSWASGIINGKKYERAALFVPVKIDTLDNTYKMQLDLGAPSNIYYGGIVNNII